MNYRWWCYFFAALLSVFACLMPVACEAAPTLGAVVNAASYARAQMPNGKLAQGGMFVAFGTGLGPVALARASTFPLPTSLSGTSIRATVGGTTVDCIVFYTSASQVAGLLPSTTPTGAGSMTITYNGETSPPLNIQVAPSTFGIFTANQSGFGPGIFVNPTNNDHNSLVKAVNPGVAVDIWGTGLGPVTGDEAAGPRPGDMTDISVQVYVGNKQADVLYRGRSGCCAGIDQVRFVVPSGVSGCYVPVMVMIGGVPSNVATVSVANSGSVCSDPGSFEAAELQNAIGKGTLRQGVVILGRSQSETSAGLTRGDSVIAGFWSFNMEQLLKAAGQSFAVGSCTVTQLPQPVIVVPAGLDAGQVRTSGPAGDHTLFSGQKGYYNIAFVPNAPAGTPGLVAGTLPAGTYSVSGSGGADVGAFSVSLTLPEIFNWTNRTAITAVNRSQDLTVTWSGAPAGAYIDITGASLFSATEGAVFWCTADASAGSFSVPARVLSSLPASGTVGGQPTGQLSVIMRLFGSKFMPTGIDQGYSQLQDNFTKPLPYQ